MAINEPDYPVICFSQNLATVIADVESLTTCTKPALRKGGFYEKLFIVDSAGMAFDVRGAEKLHGVGPFWGYNIFLNQRIKVRVHVIGDPRLVQLTEVKELLLKSSHDCDGSESRSDFEEFKASVEAAVSISEIIGLLAKCQSSLAK